MAEDDDCWDGLFGSDSDNDDEDQYFSTNEKKTATDTLQSEWKAASPIAMHLSQTFVKENPQIRLADRLVLLVRVGTLSPNNDGDCPISKSLQQRGMKIMNSTLGASNGIELDGLESMVDALIIINSGDSVDSCSRQYEMVRTMLCPGGILIHSFLPGADDRLSASTCELLLSESHQLYASSTIVWTACKKKSIRAHVSSCPWLPSSHSTEEEEDRLRLATVTLSSHEMGAELPSAQTVRQGLLTEHTIQKAVGNMKEYGYCILPGLLNQTECKEWGTAVLDSFHDAAEILLNRDGVDIYHPQSSENEPQSYQEMSMREDLRLDIRQGPALSKIRAKKEGCAKTGGKSLVVSAMEDTIGDGLFLRGHPSLLEIVRRTMNPKDTNSSRSAKPLHLGNIGRWNFGGRGNDGSYQDLRVSPVGGIVSLSGSAEQALHADTPHLFENIPDLPAHYINLFAPCTEFDDAVGGTAFVHGSHNLAFTAERYEENDNQCFYPWLVRPMLSIGDVVLFDCRILHFGLANTSQKIERCICYVNTWQDWFHDAKNWDKNRAIFECDALDAKT